MQFTPAELSILRQAAEIILRSQPSAPALPTTSRMFTVTRDWIEGNKTPGGSWKAKQLRAIGVSWPPAGGWPERSEGKQITQADRLVFESFAGDPVSKVTYPTPGKMRTYCDCDVLPWEDCIHSYGLEASADASRKP